MKRKFLKQYLIAQILFLLIMVLSVTIPNPTYAVTKTTIVSGLQAAVGAALDETSDQLYFVEYNAGTLKCVTLSPPYSPCPNTPLPGGVIANGFSHPEDVQLDLAHDLAYVTTRDDPGTTGALWKVNISTGSKSMVTFNLGAPQQLVLDTANNQAYTVGYDDGRLRRIDLTTGAKTPVFKGLGHPVGLAITKDREYAYVTEQDTGRISKIDLTTGFMVEEEVATGLTAPFFLAWTDESQNSLYVVERDPANKVSRVDLSTSTKNDAVTNGTVPPILWWRPSGIAVSSIGTPIYITTDKAIVHADMIDMGDLLKEPIFIMVGHVPADIKHINNDGYATTDPGYFYQVKHSPFGGTLNIFGNLNKFKEPSLGATYYQVQVKKDGGTFTPLNLSWNAYKWNPTKGQYELVPVAPDPAAPNPVTGPKYKIPDEYPLNATWWIPPFLMMRWPSGGNGLYEFTVKIFDAGGNDITWKFPAGWRNSLKVKVDNTPPDVKILSIWQKGTPGDPDPLCRQDKEIKACDIVSTCANKYYLKITAYDPNSHLLNYGLSAWWGDNKSGSIYDDSYSNHVDPTPPHSWGGVSNFDIPRDAPGSAGSLKVWKAKCNCAHTFYLRAWKRTIDGYNYILYRDYHKSVTINNTGVTCGEACGFPCP